MPHTQTSRKPPTPPPIPAAGARVFQALPVHRSRCSRRSEQNPRAKRRQTLALCTRFSSVCSYLVSRFLVPGRQSLVSLLRPPRTLRTPRPLYKILSFSPPQNRPIIPPSDPPQIIRGIHRRRLTDCLQHPAITGAVSIRKASPQIQVLRRRDSPNGQSFRLTKHRFAHDASSPTPVFLFQAGSADANRAGQSPRTKRGFQFAGRSRCQHFQRAADHHKQVSALRMPNHALNRLRIKRRNTQRSPFMNRNAPQIDLVRMHDVIETKRQQPHRLHKPRHIIPNPNQFSITQHQKKPPLQRRQAHERPIQIKERRNAAVLLLYFLYFLYFLYLLCLINLLVRHHVAPCATLFTLRT